jgi:C2 domain
LFQIKGFNPIWSETFEFVVTYQELAVLYIKVKDESLTGKDRMLGSYAISFTSINEG